MPSVPLVQRLEKSLERRAIGAALLEAVTRWTFWAALIVAPSVLALRWYGAIGDSVAWVVSTAPLIFGVVMGLREANRARLAPGVAIAWLDKRAGGSGALVTDAERPDPRWESEVERLLDRATHERRLSLPAVRGDRPGMFACGAIALLLTGVALQLPEPVALSTDLFLPWLERLASRVDALEDLEIDPDVAEELASRIEQLRDQLEESDTSSVYEALDRLTERLDREAEALAAAKERIEAELATASSASQGEQSPANEQAALESLSAALAEAASSGWLSPENLGALGERLSALETGSFQPGEAMQMGEAMRTQLASRFGEMVASGAFDPNALKRIAEGMNGQGEEGQGGATGEGAGTGGISRGSGAAELMFAGETEEHAEQFAERALPAATQMDEAHSELVARGEAVPEVAPEEGAAGDTRADESAGAGVWRRRVAPRHRRAVREFFGSGTEKEQ